MTSDWPPKVLFFFDWLVYLMRGTKQMIKPTVSTKVDHTDSFRLLKCMYWSHFVKRQRAFLCFFFFIQYDCPACPKGPTCLVNHPCVNGFCVSLLLCQFISELFALLL